MRTGTIVSLGASAVLGLGALVVARVWLSQPAHPPVAGQAASSLANTVPVVVASTAIPYGAKLDAAHLTVERLPPGDAPLGAYSTPAQLLSQAGGPPVALTAIAAREPLLPAKLSGPGARPTVSAAISDGMRAYTVAISDVNGVGGHVLPGDRVDVILSRDIPVISLPNQPSCGNCKRIRADVVLQDVRVLGIDLNADPTSTQSAVGHTATLEVSVQDAQKLAVAAQTGTISLALRKIGSTGMTPVRTVEIADLRSVGPRAPGPAPLPDDARLTDVIRRHLPHSPAPRGFGVRSVIVVHGDDAKPVEVPAERYGGGA
jgi:pilus assembly protein CpaB